MSVWWIRVFLQSGAVHGFYIHWTPLYITSKGRPTYVLCIVMLTEFHLDELQHCTYVKLGLVKLSCKLELHVVGVCEFHYSRFHLMVQAGYVCSLFPWETCVIDKCPPEHVNTSPLICFPCMVSVICCM